MNRGARALNDAKVGTIDDLAKKLGIDRTYCGRILASDRTPGLELRKKLRDLFEIDLDAWDEKLPNSKQNTNARRTGTSG